MLPKCCVQCTGFVSVPIVFNERCPPPVVSELAGRTWLAINYANPLSEYHNLSAIHLSKRASRLQGGDDSLQRRSSYRGHYCRGHHWLPHHVLPWPGSQSFCSHGKPRPNSDCYLRAHDHSPSSQDSRHCRFQSVCNTIRTLPHTACFIQRWPDFEGSV